MARRRAADEVTDVGWIVSEIGRINGCEATKAAALAILKAHAGKVIRFNCRTLKRPDQVHRARQLLDAGNERPIVRDRLVIEFGVSRRTAYNLICEAINGARPWLG